MPGLQSLVPKLVLLAVVPILAIAVRLLPGLLTPHGAGVDHWFWKAFINAARKAPRFPPDLPQFLLDEKQWYPPAFPLLMMLFPANAFERVSKVIAIAIDIARLLVVMAATYLITDRINSTIAAGMVYALTPILITYNTQLNPRGLGALFLDSIMLLLIWLIWHQGPSGLWLVVAFLSGLVLLTHKMTTQLYWYCCLMGGILTLDWRLIALIPVSVAMALVLSLGAYRNIWRAHWDIVTFWYRNWYWIGAHSVRESPIYGESGYLTPTRYYQSGARGLFRRLLFLVGYNPWAWVALAITVWVYGPNSRLTSEDIWVTRWLAIIVSFILLTSFVRPFRCLGLGYLYLYNTAFPSALVIGMVWGGLKHDWVVNLALALTLCACFGGILFYLRTLRTSRTLKVDHDMNRALERLAELPDGTVLCFPPHWHDVVAYKTGKAVLSGGHGYGFKHLEQLFPRVLRPIKTIVDEYEVRYLLTFEGWLPEKFVAELEATGVEEFGAYRIFRL